MKSKKKVVLNTNIQKYPKDFDELCQLGEIQNIQSIKANVSGAVEIVEKEKGKLFAFYAFSSIDGSPKTFEACASVTDRSLMKFNMTDNFVIEASNAVAHRFFDSKIETPRRLQAMAKEMKDAVIKKKTRDSMLQKITVPTLFSMDFSQIF